MVFSSPLFLFLFLPLIYLLHLAGPKWLRNSLLLVASLIFYGWGEPVFVLVMIASAMANYLLARALDHAWQKQNLAGRRFWLAATVVCNIGLLAVFKYADFLISAINQVFMTSIPLTGIPLPIGISFFTFQAMSYVLDVYRHETPVQKRCDHLLLYISFFPQLIAGPIVKYHDVADQITSRHLSLADTAPGIRRFIVGLAKKLLLANLAGQIADQVFALPDASLMTAVSWLGAITYMLQIYFDFSGYSDMAIGLGHMFGFTFKENFNYPYSAASMQDFWRRWHISLSTWFKEYLYIPLGGNRKGSTRAGINRVIVFFFTGLWHGAAWTFVAWGFYHGFFLLLESFRIIKPDKLWRPLRHFYTLLVVLIGFVLFRADTLRQFGAFCQSMFIDLQASSPAGWRVLMENLTPGMLILLPAAMLSALPILPWLKRKLASSRLPQTWSEGSGYVLSLLLLALCLLALSAATYNPFIYFRF